MKKLLLTLILLLGFHNVLNAAPIDNLVNLFPYEQREKMIKDWQERRSIFVCKSFSVNGGRSWGTKTQTLPENFWIELRPLLREVKKLYLIDCDLETIPVTLNCPNLEHLELKHNRLKRLDVTRCPKLSWLGLEVNTFEETPNLTKCPELAFLIMRHCNLTTTPNLSACPKLVILDLSENNLDQTPDTSAFEQLSILRLNNNRLTQTPNLSRCDRLETLRLHDNQLTETPNLSACIYHLETLNLENNRLTQTPDLSKHQRLRNLHLNDNYLDQKPTLHSKCSVYLGGNNWRQKKHEGVFEDA